MSRSFLTGLNLNKNELLNARIQNLSTAPSSPVLGQIYYDTDTNQLTLWNGTAWVSLAEGGDVTSIITAAIDALDTDDIEEGSTNKYYTDERTQDAIGNAIAAGAQSGITVTYTDASNKIDFTVADQWTGKDTDDLTEGTTNLYFTTERAQDAIGGSVGNGVSYNDTSGAISVNLGASGGLEFSTGAVVVDRDVTDTWYDAAGAASTVAGNLTTHESDTSTHGVTGAIVGTTDSQTLTNKTLSTGIVLSANVNAATYTITNLATPSANTDAATKSYVDTAVSGLVDGAPALLDTLNELAAAINDDASFSTTITTSIGTKVSKSGDTMTGALTLHADPSSTLHAATKSYVDNAISTRTTKYAANNTLLEPTSNVVTWVVNHSLGSRDVTVQVYELGSYTQVEVDVARTNTAAVTLTFIATANVAADSYRAVVVG